MRKVRRQVRGVGRLDDEGGKGDVGGRHGPVGKEVPECLAEHVREALHGQVTSAHGGREAGPQDRSLGRGYDDVAREAVVLRDLAP